MLPVVEFVLNGEDVSVVGTGTLLDALREELGIASPKDGCSPQGQCGCCTVWVDGQPRVSCVTPVARVQGRSITTVEGLDDADRWATVFCENGGSQCGFCTPGIIMRAAALDHEKRSSPDAVKKAMLAHMCRCTGWQPVIESIIAFQTSETKVSIDIGAAERRAELEGGVPQQVGPAVALGQGGFADDTAPLGALVAVRDASGGWVVGETLTEARELSGKVQGRRTTAPLGWPLDLPDGDWARTLQTTWVEPAYLEPDASWCAPGGEPMSSHGNGGAFGAKMSGELGIVARRLADQHGRVVRVLSTREDVVRLGAKRPPVALGLRSDGSGVLRAVTTEGLDELMRVSYPNIELEAVSVSGPPTSLEIRGAVWAEVEAARASLQNGSVSTVVSSNGAVARAAIDADGTVTVSVRCGDVLDEKVLRSYCTGAAHMALGWVRSEGLSVDSSGAVHDLTIRSFGVLRAVDTPEIKVSIEPSDDEPVGGSDAVFAAVAAAAWSASGFQPRWPIDR